MKFLPPDMTFTVDWVLNNNYHLSICVMYSSVDWALKANYFSILYNIKLLFYNYFCC